MDKSGCDGKPSLTLVEPPRPSVGPWVTAALERSKPRVARSNIDPTSWPDAERLISPADTAISRSLREHIRMVLGILTSREEQIVRMRFGIGDTRDHPPEEIARRLALSRERVFSIQADALRKLRRPSASRHLKPVNRP